MSKAIGGGSSLLEALFGGSDRLTPEDVRNILREDEDKKETLGLRGDLDAQLRAIAGMNSVESAVARHTDPAHKVSVPLDMSLDRAELQIKKQREAEEVSQVFHYRIKANYMDGLVALQAALQAVYGMSGAGVSKWTMFGEIKPENIDIQVGLAPHPDDMTKMIPVTKSVPASEFDFAPMEARFEPYVWSDGDNYGLFAFSVTLKQGVKYRAEAAKVMVEKYLENHSIYRGQILEFDPSGANGVGLTQVDRRVDETIVYTGEVRNNLQNNVWGKISRRHQLEANGLRSDFRVLMYGPLGTGKSAGMVQTAVHAKAQGQTVIEYRPTTNPSVAELQRVYAVAKMYAPAVILVEDFDRFFPFKGGDRAILTNLLDGVDKNNTVSMLMTTNFLDSIDPSVIRQPRLTGLVEIKHLDRDGIEKLLHLTLGDRLDPETDFEQVWQVVQSYSPSFIRKTYDNARAYAIQNDDSGLIGTEALVNAARDLHDQHSVYERLNTALNEPQVDHLRVGLQEVVKAAVVEEIAGQVARILASHVRTNYGDQVAVAAGE